MKKRIKPMLLIFLIICVVFTGCKIEKPDDVANDENSNVCVETTLDSNQSTETSKEAEDAEDTESASDTEKTEETKSEEAVDNKEANSKDTENNVDKKEENKTENESKQTGKQKTRQELLEEANKHRESGTKDKYLTDPTPEGMPKPVEWQDAKIDKSKVRHCTLSIDCLTILDNMNQFNKDKMSVLPKDGIIYKTRRVEFYEGESVFDMLNREMKKNRIHMEFVMTPIYNSNYIEGIHNLYEFDCGELSGWMYKVNGWYPNYGCSRYVLKDGDVVNWRYTCDLGRDVGCTWIGETVDD